MCILEPPSEPSCKIQSACGLTFPDYQHPPTMFLKFGSFKLIAPLGSPELLFPELKIRFRSGGATTTRMAMPKTTVNKNSRLVLGQNNVRGSRQVLCVKTESVAEFVKQAANNSLRACVSALYPRHQLRSG